MHAIGLISASVPTPTDPIVANTDANNEGPRLSCDLGPVSHYLGRDYLDCILAPFHCAAMK